VARVPLEEIAHWSEGQNSGVIYVFFGPESYEKIHYGIRYDLRVEAGVLSSKSEIWMGSMYDLDGRVLIPQEGEVLLDHWFDFRPIPEIEGKNSRGPKLLGIPEHQTN
jgi:hypothetical protein